MKEITCTTGTLNHNTVVCLLLFSFAVQLATTAEHILHYINADDGQVVGTTYRAIWQMVKDIDGDECFARCDDIKVDTSSNVNVAETNDLNVHDGVSALAAIELFDGNCLSHGTGFL